ncbi:MAG: ABC transporter permease [Methanothrix sp.]|nr:ABC transporter permease [Methanothrix sp.]MDD4446308.1 ABC transporter permease [Methanothrix sp.]
MISGKKAYFLGKLIRYAFTLFLILSLNFALPRMMPGDPIVNLLGEEALHNDPRMIELLRAEHGLDKPLHIQYISYLRSLAGMDLGYSIHKNLSVAELMVNSLIWTMLLVFPSVLIGSILALLFGSLAGFKSNSPTDLFLTTLALLFYTCPPFLLAMLLLSIFAFHLGLFPLGNLTSGGRAGLDYFLDVAWHLFLPVSALSLLGASYKFLVVRNSVTQIFDEQFIVAARAKGLTERCILLRHVIRNVLPPFISMVAISLGFMVSGALIVEIVFSLNGMGTLIYDAVVARDYPVMQGSFLVLTMFVLAANFAADMLYAVADPRIGGPR